MVDGARLLLDSDVIAGGAALLSPSLLNRYRAFAAGMPLGPAQEPRWVEAWQHTAPILMIELLRDGDPVLMLPLELVKLGPFNVARFVGGRHANANFPAFVDDAGSDGKIAEAVMAALRQSGHGADLLLLERMNDTRGAKRSPLLAFGTEPSPNIALAVSLDADWSAMSAGPRFKKHSKRHRSQARKLEAAGGWRRVRAGTPAEVSAMLEAFFALKGERFRQAGIPDVFADPGVKQAFEALFTGALSDPEPRFSIEGLEVDGKLRAITGSSFGPDRATCEFGAIADDELSKMSPGEFLFYLNIREATEAGRAFYDFGVGDEPYKRSWCDVEITHFDAMAPLTVQGQILAGMLRSSALLKRALKRNQVLWQAFKRLRKQTAGTLEAVGGSD